MNFTENILTVDFGNTNSTCCLFQSDELKEVFPFSELELKIKKFSMTKDNTRIYYSSVSESADFPQAWEIKNLKSEMSDGYFLDMSISYTETVGIDRVIIAYYYFLKKQSALLIDLGTFTTADYINESGYQGGYILPGLELLRSSFQQGEQLKVYHPQLTQLKATPQNSQDAINQGYSFSFLAPILKIIERYQVPVILTGGASEKVYPILKELRSDASIQIEPYLIHKSMMEIAKALQ